MVDAFLLHHPFLTLLACEKCTIPFLKILFFKDTVTFYNLLSPEGLVCLQVRYLENVIGLSVAFLSH